MLIAIDARFYRSGTGGIGRYTRALIRELAKYDRENEYLIFITPEDEKEYDKDVSSFQLSVTRFQKIVVPIKHYSFKEQTKFLSILNKYKPDLVHFTNFNHPIFYKGKFVITVHDLTLMFYSKNYYPFHKRAAFRIIMQNAVKNSEFIISDSDATKNDLIEHLKAEPKKIKTIYLGVDSQYNSHVEVDKKVLDKYKINGEYLLFLSQWRPHKGIIELVKAFNILKEKYKISEKLVLEGKPNPQFPEIMHAIKSSPYSKDIIMTGFVDNDDLAAIYKSANIFVFPSQYEGFGLPPLEAMAIGTPVLSSNLSCMPEVLGNAAEYFNPANSEEMAEKIYQTLKNKNLQKTMIKKGFEQVKKYSWTKMAEETLEIYKKAIKS